MPVLVLFDHFKAQLTNRVLDTLESHDINVNDMPAKCTDLLQPLYVSVNKAIKNMRESLQSWYANEVLKQQGEYKLINLKLSTLKPLGAQWLERAFKHVSQNNQIIKNGFNEVGITSKLNRHLYVQIYTSKIIQVLNSHIYQGLHFNMAWKCFN